MYVCQAQQDVHVCQLCNLFPRLILFDGCPQRSGESGAGKTESAKYIIRQLMQLCRSRQDGVDKGNLEDKILQVCFLLD